MAVRMCLLAVDCQARSHVVFHFWIFYACATAPQTDSRATSSGKHSIQVEEKRWEASIQPQPLRENTSGKPRFNHSSIQPQVGNLESTTPWK